MCGIFFCIWNTNLEKKILRNVKESFSLLNHRGPDNQRLLKKDEWAIGHTRLSIIDTSSRSNQPFSDEKQIYFLSFNGEIYNYEELRAFLLDEGIDFKTSSDTEVLFKLLVHKGLEKTLKLIKGMFSFVFFDSEKKKNIWS